MKVLLTAINAKYIHSNLGIYSLKAYADRELGRDALAGCKGKSFPISIELAEYTINHQRDMVLQEIYKKKPDLIGFSCYIWNISFIEALVSDLKKVLPGLLIWFGGPEVSYDSLEVLKKNPAVTGILKGEGEASLAQLLKAYRDQSSLKEIPGLAFRENSGAVMDTGARPVLDLSSLPFAYGFLDMKGLEHRIVYYESSRGCPFSCSYCLSSLDKQVRFRSLELVRQELSFFLKAGVPQVKFVDRTFNCKKGHAMAIWQFIKENDNGVTNFHFEIAADLLDQEEIELLSSLRPGLVQLEIGVQSVNPASLKAIRRKTDLERIRHAVSEINAKKNVHQHLDLIAGLPYEGLSSFQESFNQIYDMKPEQLQLGFLKVLKGSYMEEMSASYDLCYSASPPYEVLSTKWLSYEEILELKAVEEMVEVYYNSRQFTLTLECLSELFHTPYELFCRMALYHSLQGIRGISQSRLGRYEILWSMLEELLEKDKREQEKFRDALMCDLYLRENAKSRPSFARDQKPYQEAVRAFFSREEAHPEFLKGYEGYHARQLGKMAHIEAMRDGSLILFDYKNRDPLSHNASMFLVQPGCPA